MFQKVTLLEVSRSPFFIGVAGIVAELQLCTPTFSIRNKELKQVYFIAHDKIFCPVFHRVQYQDHFCLFNVFLRDLFLVIDNIDSTSYADDSTPYTTDESAEKVVDKFEIVAKSLFKWFSDNQMKANPDKCHLLTSSTSQSELKIGNVTINSSVCEKLLGIKLDNK